MESIFLFLKAHLINVAPLTYSSFYLLIFAGKHRVGDSSS